MNSKILLAACAAGIGAVAIAAASTQVGYRGPAPKNNTPIACGAPYAVVRGDTLRDITIRAYGHDDWKVLMRANRGTIARAEVLEIGWHLAIPCPDGTVQAAAPAAPAQPAPAPAAAIQTGRSLVCGQPYRIGRGDTLRKISRRVYGNDDIEPIIMANKSRIRHPDRLEIGWVIDLPCPGAPIVAAVTIPPPSEPRPEAETLSPGSVRKAAPRGAATASTGASASVAPVFEPAIEPVKPPAAATAAEGDLDAAKGVATAAIPCPDTCKEVLPPISHEIRFLTGGDYPPFAGQSLESGGMITELVSRSLEIAGPDRSFRVDYVDDWDAHLDVLMPTQVFDLGFPWFRPDCEKAALLTEDMRMRCTTYDYSHPLFEVVVGYFVRAGDALAVSGDRRDLAGKRLCRPAGSFDFDLAQDGLLPPAITLTRPTRPEECFRLLLAGEVDAVSVPVPAGDAVIRKLRIEGQVTEASDLATIETMHVIAHKANPFGRPYLAMINRGLRELQESGEWFEIVSRHLAKQMQYN